MEIVPIIDIAMDLNQISEGKWTQRYYQDMKSLYEINEYVDNPLIYKYCNINEGKSSEELLYGVTKIYPGTIENEFFMTKGHLHKANTAEIYYCLEGNGLILQENGIFTPTLTKISTGKLFYCLSGYAHRVINNSDNILILLCVTRADAGHNYDFNFTTRVKKD